MLARALLIALFLFSATIRAETPAEVAASPQLTAEQKQKAESLIVALGADEYEKREAAQKELETIGPAAIPLLKTAAANAEDAEVKSRASRLVEQLEIKQRLGALLADCGNDPEKVLLKAIEMKRAKKGKEAAELYLTAAGMFREKAKESDDQRIKQTAEAKAQLCERGARMSSQVATGAVNGQFIQVNGGAGGQVRIRVNQVGEDPFDE